MMLPEVAGLPLPSPGNQGSSAQEQAGAGRRRRARKRRGATAMEYLVAISFILVALIIGVQHFGAATKSLFSTSANATANTVQP